MPSQASSLVTAAHGPSTVLRNTYDLFRSEERQVLEYGAPLPAEASPFLVLLAPAAWEYYSLPPRERRRRAVGDERYGQEHLKAAGPVQPHASVGTESEASPGGARRPGAAGERPAPGGSGGGGQGLPRAGRAARGGGRPAL